MRLYPKTIIVASMMFAPMAFGQWTPVYAKQQETTTVTGPNSASIKNTVVTSDYYRSGSGSDLSVSIADSSDGVIHKKTAVLHDNEGRAQYSLDYTGKVAYRVSSTPTSREFDPRTDSEYSKLTHETVQGLDCVVVPVYFGDERVGSYWIAVNYDLTVKSDVTYPGGSYKTRVVKELTGIRFGEKLDPSLFQVPPDFVIRPAATQPHPKVTTAR